MTTLASSKREHESFSSNTEGSSVARNGFAAKIREYQESQVGRNNVTQFADVISERLRALLPSPQDGHNLVSFHSNSTEQGISDRGLA